MAQNEAIEEFLKERRLKEGNKHISVNQSKIKK